MIAGMQKRPKNPLLGNRPNPEQEHEMVYQNVSQHYIRGFPESWGYPQSSSSYRTMGFSATKTIQGAWATPNHHGPLGKSMKSWGHLQWPL